MTPFAMKRDATVKQRSFLKLELESRLFEKDCHKPYKNIAYNTMPFRKTKLPYGLDSIVRITAKLSLANS